MEAESYRLASDSLAIRTSKGDRSTITIPAGEIVAILDGPMGTKQIIEVDWKGENLLMFADDLQHSETSFFSEARKTSRAANVDLSPTGSERREQALIEHSIELADANQELERFALGAAHDLLEPLRSMQAMMELVLQRSQNKVDAESAQMLRFVVRGAERMKVLIRDLLAFAVASDPGETTPVDVQRVVALATQNLSQAIEESGARIEIESLPVVHANGDQLLRLFQNLISNAIKYGSESTPVIRISASSEAGDWTCSVSDNGIGIDSKHHDQIFAAFRRLHKTSDHEGSGVGLAICKRIVDQYGGRIWVESEPGHGSTFYFTIPVSMDSSSHGSDVSRKPTVKSDQGGNKSRAVGR